MGLSLSYRQNIITQSEIRNMTRECKLAGGINLAQGVCDTDIVPQVKEGAKRAIDGGINSYTRYDGLPELREAISIKHEKRTGMKTDPETQVLVSAGTTGVFYAAALALLNPGDEVIVFEPFYSYHISTLQAVDVKPVYVRMHLPDWSIDPAEIRSKMTSRTRGIIINTPANPSGKIFSLTELQMLGEIAREYDIFIFTDEIYEDFVYDGHRHIAPVTAGDLAQRTITISGFSKIFSITGWRIGYCICDPKWADAIGQINDLVYVCAPAPLQAGVTDALNELDESYYRDVAKKYQKRRDFFCNTLKNAGFEPHVPQGAYYVLTNLEKVPGKTSKEKAMEFLKATGVAGVPGEAFYHDGSGKSLIRFCFAKDDTVLEEVARRIKNAYL